MNIQEQKQPRNVIQAGIHRLNVLSSEILELSVILKKAGNPILSRTLYKFAEEIEQVVPNITDAVDEINTVAENHAQVMSQNMLDAFLNSGLYRKVEK